MYWVAVTPSVAAASVVAAVDLSLSNIVVIIAIVLGGIVTLRVNIAKTWEANYSAEKARGDRLEIESRDLLAEKVKLQSDLKSAELRTDLTGLYKMSEQNHKDMMGVLQKILERLEQAVPS